MVPVLAVAVPGWRLHVPGDWTRGTAEQPIAAAPAVTVAAWEPVPVVASREPAASAVVAPIAAAAAPVFIPEVAAKPESKPTISFAGWVLVAWVSGVALTLASTVLGWFSLMRLHDRPSPSKTRWRLAS